MEYDRTVSLFCLTANRKVDSSSLICYLYFCQRIGFNLGYQFRSTPRCIQSSKVDAYLDLAVFQDKLAYDKDTGKYNYVMTGDSSLVPVGYTDMEVLDNLFKVLSDLSAIELSFLVALDMLNLSISQDKKLKEMSFDEQRSYISTTLERLYPIYTDEVFTEACKRIIEIERLEADNE